MMRAMRLLAIETSTPRGSLALFEDGALIGSDAFQAHRGHNSAIYQPLQSLLGDEPLRSGVGWIVVGTGPGSYTGVRISIAIADALALSLGAELVGVSSFLAPAEHEATAYTVVGDARRDRWYRVSIRGRQLQEPIVTEPRHTFEDDVRDVLAKGEPVITYDSVAPMAGVKVTYPCAIKLGEWFLRRGQLAASPLPVEPMYLAGPHITIPKEHAKPRDRSRGSG